MRLVPQVAAQWAAGALLIVFEHRAGALGVLAAHDADLRHVAVAPELLGLRLRQDFHFALAVSSCCWSAKIEV